MGTDGQYAGRIAPSPTGYLHLGHAATFLTAAERAREAGGRLWLRMDDLDGQRSRAEYAEAAREDLAWLGIAWEAEWRQSERLPRYRAAMERLIGAGLVYPCACSRKDLDQATEAPHEEGDEPVYNGRCRPAVDEDCRPALKDASRSAAIAGSRKAGAIAEATNYRFHVPDGEAVCFADLACGAQRMMAGRDFGDFLVWRRDGLPSYQLATVVDDAEMGVTEVVRGEDLLRSTARQILLQRALGKTQPAYVHTPLLRDAQGVRLAKRNAALSLRTLRDEGVTPAEIRARVATMLHQNLL